jgi:hypothetical protein
VGGMSLAENFANHDLSKAFTKFIAMALSHRAPKDVPRLFGSLVI